MIDLVLRVPLQFIPVAREIVGECPGIELVDDTADELDRLTDIDALVLGDRMGVEYFLAKPPRTLVEIVVDPAADVRVKLYEATVSPANVPGAQLHTAASWIVIIGHKAGLTKGGVKVKDSSFALNDIERLLFRNALDVIERQNTTGAQPPIGRLALIVDDAYLPRVLRAYDEYRGQQEV